MALMKSCCFPMMKTLYDITRLYLTQKTQILHMLGQQYKKSLVPLKSPFDLPISPSSASYTEPLFVCVLFVVSICVHIHLSKHAFILVWLFVYPNVCVCVVRDSQWLRGVFWQQMPTAKSYSRSLLHQSGAENESREKPLPPTTLSQCDGSGGRGAGGFLS